MFVCTRAHCCGHMPAFCEFLLLGTCKRHTHFMCACVWEPWAQGCLGTGNQKLMALKGNVHWMARDFWRPGM